MKIDKFAVKHNLTRQQIIEEVQKTCPRFTKVQMSMVCNSDYGVELSPAAKKSIKNRWEPKAPAVRKLPRQCSSCGAITNSTWNYCPHCGKENE